MAHLVVVHHAVLALLLSCSTSTAFFDWMKRPAAPSPSPPPAPVQPGGDAPPFEMMVSDEKFLVEAKQMELSPLDSCHYMVVAQLKSTCGSLSEEQLAKLGVVLFNCQAEVEGRRTYRCTDEMSLRQCTADMDADTWNAYHIVSNRARAVCYATRQQHFRRRAELTVNALISTATSQLDAMKDLKEGQLELRDLTAASLDKLLQGHSALQAQQGALWLGQEELESSLSSNLERLGQEKALIASGQELVAQLIKGITQRMENVSEQMKGQGSEVQEGHKAILDDLAEVRGRAQDIYSKIESSMSGFLLYQNQTARYYADLMGKLERMNSTLGAMLHYLDNMHTRLEDRLHAIQDYLGWAGLSLAALWTCVVHAGYFLLCAVLLTFLRCPCFTRAMLLLTVPLNAVAEVNRQPSLDLMGLSLLLVTLSLGHWFVTQLSRACSWIGGKQTSLPFPPTTKILESEPIESPQSHYQKGPSCSTPQKDELDGVMEPEDFLDQESFMCAPYSGQQVAEASFVPVMAAHNQSTPRFMVRPSFSAAVLESFPHRNLGGGFEAVYGSRSSSPNQSLASNGSLSCRQLCNGTTRTGKQCKNRAVLGQDYCHVHDRGYTSYIRP
ncbi:protein brambleberry [Osmerus eperlanus]|uniref:protein brambleberry n=1 Tax=Osmerus eperlanus TaxID=29151 RepID=UPI002E135188